jgi:hypothetical protein
MVANETGRSAVDAAMELLSQGTHVFTASVVSLREGLSWLDASIFLTAAVVSPHPIQQAPMIPAFLSFVASRLTSFGIGGELEN